MLHLLQICAGILLILFPIPIGGLLQALFINDCTINFKEWIRNRLGIIGGAFLITLCGILLLSIDLSPLNNIIDLTISILGTGLGIFLAISWAKAWPESNNIHSLKIVSTIVSILSTIILCSFIVAVIVSGFNTQNDDTKMVKCSWCGKVVPEYKMEGNWCKDCQNKAFGEDGWYNDIKDIK